jgi:hypothetical protein
MKKFLATVSAVALSLAMVAMPSVAMADEGETTEAVTTEVATTEVAPEPVAPEPVVTEPVVTEPVVTEPVVTEPVVTEPVVTEPTVTEPVVVETATELADVATTQGTLALSRSIQTTSQPVDHCTFSGDGWQPKVEDGGEDPFYVLIPDGVIVVAYCVKAANLDLDAPVVITLPEPFVGDGETLLQLDHPDANSVSHYQLKLGTPEVEDVCDNIDGIQTEVPEGYVLAENGTSCVEEEEECIEPVNGGGFSILIVEECPDLEVEVSGTATDQVCEASGDESVGTLVQGSIQLIVSDSDGVTKIEYSKDGGSTSEVNLATLLIEDLAPGTYDFVVTVADGYESVDNFSITVKADNDPECKKQTICHWTPGGKGELGKYVEIDVSIKSIINVPNGHHLHENDIIPPFDYYVGDTLVSYPGLNFDPEVEGCDDADLPTEGPVVPEVIFTPATCDTNGSYTLIAPPLTEGVPADAVSFFVNDVETAPGTYPVAAGEVITVKVVANYEEFPLDLSLPGGFVSEYTYPAFEFTAPTGCSLTTLALTGAGDTTPALALTAFLGLLGLAMVRSGIRINRNRREA